MKEKKIEFDVLMLFIAIPSEMRVTIYSISTADGFFYFHFPGVAFVPHLPRVIDILPLSGQKP